MKTLIVLALGLLAVGCGQSDTERLEQENRRIEAQLKNDKLKAEIEAKNKKKKDDLLRFSVAGEYEYKRTNGDTYKYVFLDNGIKEWYTNGKKHSIEFKWSIVKEEIHVKHDSGFRDIWRINKDKSITKIAWMNKDGKRTDRPKDRQRTDKKIK